MLSVTLHKRVFKRCDVFYNNTWKHTHNTLYYLKYVIWYRVMHTFHKYKGFIHFFFLLCLIDICRTITHYICNYNSKFDC